MDSSIAIAVIGYRATGKSSIVYRYANGEFSAHVPITNCIDYYCAEEYGRYITSSGQTRS